MTHEMNSLQLAVNYSEALAGVIRAGEVDVDRFKTPAWPELVAKASTLRPVYVHFPLSLGHGLGCPLDSEQGTPVDWRRVDALLASTATPYVNVHLMPYARPGETEVEVYERAAADLAPVLARYGPERVIVENEHGPDWSRPAPGVDPAFITRLVTEAGCGFLLDLSHARLAAERQGEAERAYVQRLPLDRVREVHVTGIQLFDDAWRQRALDVGIDAQFIDRYTGRRLDHLPFIDEDWPVVAWALAELVPRAAPWIVAFEYGGVGLPWEAIGRADVLRRQVPRLATLLAAARRHT